VDIKRERAKSIANEVRLETKVKLNRGVNGTGHKDNSHPRVLEALVHVQLSVLSVLKTAYCVKV